MIGAAIRWVEGEGGQSEQLVPRVPQHQISCFIWLGAKEPVFSSNPIPQAVPPGEQANACHR